MIKAMLYRNVEDNVYHTNGECRSLKCPADDVVFPKCVEIHLDADGMYSQIRKDGNLVGTVCKTCLRRTGSMTLERCEETS